MHQPKEDWGHQQRDNRMNDPGQALLQVASEQGFLGQRDEENIRKGKLREPFWRMWLNSQPAQRHSQK